LLLLLLLRRHMLGWGLRLLLLLYMVDAQGAWSVCGVVMVLLLLMGVVVLM
jgi:hypothetical protein